MERTIRFLFVGDENHIPTNLEIDRAVSMRDKDISIEEISKEIGYQIVVQDIDYNDDDLIVIKTPDHYSDEEKMEWVSIFDAFDQFDPFEIVCPYIDKVEVKTFPTKSKYIVV